jgi:hypothetical protein
MRAAIGLVAVLAAAGCGRATSHRPGLRADEPPSAPGPGQEGSRGQPPDPLAPLHAFEEERRRAVDFAHLPPSDHALGPDPIAVRRLPAATGRARFAGLLRGRDALVLLDASLHEVARAPAPALPTGLAVAADGEVFVSGEQSPQIARFRVEGDAIRPSGAVDLSAHARGLRDVAVGGEGGRTVVYAVEEHDGRLFAIDPAAPSAPTVRAAGAGAFRVARAGGAVLVDCLLDHTLAAFDLDARGLPGPAPRAVLRHDGPIWGFDAAATDDGLLLAAGGIEDHPLDRTGGSFGFIDSFVFLYRLARGALAFERIAAVDVSAHGAITPKALLLRAEPDGGATVTAAGYGGDRLVVLTFPAGLRGDPAVATRAILPGAAAMAGDGDALVLADPLLDAWLRVDASPAVPAPVPDAVPPRGAASRLGEALFFTNLMAPWNSSEGRLSRFTCEACHFEGYADGRTHHTGRGDVHATTKPLLGLFNNRPHFSRALDPDLATMVNNEFRVAGALSGHDPWFSAGEAGLAWTPLLGAPAADLDAIGLRRALMTFLMDFTHRPNPAVLGRTSFSARERRGAEVFAARCERCHAARLVTDDPASRVPFDRWEALVLSREGPIVWARDGYHRTGVEPYVHDLGARAPSLRRLYKKRPYFTNGSAKSLLDVLDRVRVRGDELLHDRAPDGFAPLDAEEQDALAAFLDLL